MSDSIIDSEWTEKYRPRTLDDIILPEQTRMILDAWVAKGIPNHILLCSRPGQGKTTLAKILAYDVFKADTLYINASDKNDVEAMRSTITDFCYTASFDGGFKIVILDECDNFSSPKTQKILRGLLQDCKDNVRFILTANYANRVIEPIKSRCTELDITPPMKEVAKRVLDILKKENVIFDSEEQKSRIGKAIKRYHPDVRSVIKNIQKWVNSDNVLCLPDYTVDVDFLIKLLDFVLENKPMELRRFLIENEQEFNCDYQALLCSFYYLIIASDKVDAMKRAKWSISLAEYISKFGLVIDPEINASACFFSLMEL